MSAGTGLPTRRPAGPTETSRRLPGVIGRIIHDRRRKRAERLFACNQPGRAAKLLAASARQGDAQAGFRLAECYLTGQGAPLNTAEAGLWLEKAAHLGHARAQFGLASLCLHGFQGEPDCGTGTDGLAAKPEGRPDVARAVLWLREAAASRLPEAQALLGHLILNGQASALFDDEAENLLRRSAESGCPQGDLGYALHLIRLGGRSADWPRVVHHAERAAEAGLPSALHLLGTLVAGGHAPGLGPAASALLLRQAAEAGLSVAQRHLGLTLIDDVAGDPKGEDGLYWLRRAALQGDGPAAHELAKALLSRAHVARDPAEAARWLGLAMQRGQSAAAADLAQLVLAGEAGDGAAHAVAAWFRTAAEAGNAEAAYNYAVCLAQGLGTIKDERAALPWLARAADSLPEACLWHRRLQDATG